MTLRPSFPSPLRSARSVFVSCSVLAFWTSPADATFSVLAVDKSTGVIGGAAASCVGTNLSLSEIIVIAPEVGGVIAQALYWPPGRDRVFEELQSGASPSDSIQAAVDPAFDAATHNAGPEHRQYAAITLDGRVAAFTGASTLTFAGHRTGAADRFVYSIQGNTLAGKDVLDSLEGALLSSEGGVGQRLIASFQAIAESGRGDSRCSPFTADAAYFELHVPGEAPLTVEAVVPDGDATAALVQKAAPLLPSEPEVTEEGNSNRSTSPRASGSGCHYVQGRFGAWNICFLALLGVSLRGRGRRLTTKGL